MNNKKISFIAWKSKNKYAGRWGTYKLTNKISLRTLLERETIKHKIWEPEKILEII